MADINQAIVDKLQEFATNMNYNDAKSNNFAISIPHMPEVIYFTQEISLPSISLGIALQETPLPFNIKHAGDKVEYDELNITVSIDEEFKVVESIMDWIKETSPALCPADTELSGLYPDGKRDIIVYVLSNNANPIAQFTYSGCFPMRLGNVEMDYTTATDKMKLTITFSTDHVEFTRL